MQQCRFLLLPLLLEVLLQTSIRQFERLDCQKGRETKQRHQEPREMRKILVARLLAIPFLLASTQTDFLQFSRRAVGVELSILGFRFARPPVWRLSAPGETVHPRSLQTNQSRFREAFRARALPARRVPEDE